MNRLISKGRKRGPSTTSTLATTQLKDTLLTRTTVHGGTPDPFSKALLESAEYTQQLITKFTIALSTQRIEVDRTSRSNTGHMRPSTSIYCPGRGQSQICRGVRHSAFD